MKIIDGKALAEKIKDQIVKEIVSLSGARPNLAIILIGGRPDSELYVSLKEREAKKVGIDTHLYKCAENISQAELLSMIKCLNDDELIDAILLQLPLPAGLDADAAVKAIKPGKDVDGFQPENLKKLLAACDAEILLPPVFATALEMLTSIDYDLKNKNIVIISNSDIFGQSLKHVLNCRGAKAEAVKADDYNLAAKTKPADVLITAAGKPEFIKKDMIKPDAVVIDIGINEKGKKVVGDIDFEDVKDKAGYITPVPGGVGPLTIAMAFKNTLELYKKRRNK